MAIGGVPALLSSAVADTFLPDRVLTGANFMLLTNSQEKQRSINQGRDPPTLWNTESAAGHLYAQPSLQIAPGPYHEQSRIADRAHFQR